MRTAIKRDHSCLMHHLVANDDEAWSLNDVVGVAVNGRHHRARDASRDAAIVKAAIGIRIGGSAAAPFTRLGARGLTCTRLGGQRWDLSGRRIAAAPRPATPP